MNTNHIAPTNTLGERQVIAFRTLVRLARQEHDTGITHYWHDDDYRMLRVYLDLTVSCQVSFVTGLKDVSTVYTDGQGNPLPIPQLCLTYDLTPPPPPPLA